MKILVTGGAGFIGSNLVDVLIAKNYEVVVIDDLSSGQEENIDPKAKFYKVDIRSEEIKDIFKKEKFDYIFHLAAHIHAPASLHKPLHDGSINVLGSLNIFKNAIDHGAKRVIFMSSGGAIYGDTAEPAHEGFDLKAENLYGVHKYTSEKNLELLAKNFGIKYTILRPANVYGPRQYKGGEGAVIAVFTANAINNQESILYGDGGQTRDFIYVGDLVDVCQLCLEKNLDGVYNVGTGQDISILDLVESIENVMGERKKIKKEAARKGDPRKSVLDISRIKSEFSWEPRIKLEEGLRKTIEWFKEYNQK